MISIEEKVSLKAYNTLGIEAIAERFCRISDPHQLEELVASSDFKPENCFILGGGSNVLFTGHMKGLIIKSELKGITKVKEEDDRVTLKVSSGEQWHQLVMHTLAHDWGGLENLSLIPGTVGGAPVQNIGAYGIEIREVVDEVEGIDLSTGELRKFSNQECQFGYRDSVFKKEFRKKFFISSVTLTLTSKNHRLNVRYGAIKDTLKEMRVDHPTIHSVSDAVIRIRQSKLPDPAVIGNAGSFFKNPTLPRERYEYLLKKHLTMPGYRVDNQNIKVPAGWLIEQCGWKGKKVGNTGVHPMQALVLVNYGGATGVEILELSKEIQRSVNDKFGIMLTPEVNIL